MRFLILLLLLAANVGYFAWTSGWLRDWGLAPAAQTEPQRLAQQIRPEALRIIDTGNTAGSNVGNGPAVEAPAETASPPLTLITTATTTTTAITTTTRMVRTASPSTVSSQDNAAAAVAAAAQAAASAASAMPAPVPAPGVVQPASAAGQPP